FLAATFGWKTLLVSLAPAGKGMEQRCRDAGDAAEQGQDEDADQYGEVGPTPRPAPRLLRLTDWSRQDRFALRETGEVVGQILSAEVTAQRLFAEAFKADCLQV